MKGRRKRNFDTIGLSRVDPQNPFHMRVIRKRNEYRLQMQKGVSLRSFRELFFACSSCGDQVALPQQAGYCICGSCGQYFKKCERYIREVDPPEDWYPHDQAQLDLFEPP